MITPKICASQLSTLVILFLSFVFFQRCDNKLLENLKKTNQSQVETVESVTVAEAAGTYGAPGVLSIQVKMSEEISVSGTPYLSLNSGGTANYKSSSNGIVTFAYTVGRNDSTTALEITAFVLNGGLMISSSNNSIQKLVLPTAGSAKSLSGSKTIKIASIQGMSYIPTGTYQMGSDYLAGLGFGWPTSPVHTVTLSAFFIDQYEVSVADYVAFLNSQELTDTGRWCNSNLTATDGASGARHPGNLCMAQFHSGYVCGISRSGVSGSYSYAIQQSGVPTCSNHPIFWTTWQNSNDYCQWKSKRLPTDAEWEYAATGRTTGTYNGKKLYPIGANGSDTITQSDARYFTGTGQYNPRAVGGFAAAPNELYDMAGNQYEWVADGEYNYTLASATNPTNPAPTVNGIIRGSAYMSSDVNANSGAMRQFWGKNDRQPYNSFRCAKNVQ